MVRPKNSEICGFCFSLVLLCLQDSWKVWPVCPAINTNLENPKQSRKTQLCNSRHSPRTIQLACEQHFVFRRPHSCLHLSQSVREVCTNQNNVFYTLQCNALLKLKGGLNLYICKTDLANFNFSYTLKVKLTTKYTKIGPNLSQKNAKFNPLPEISCMIVEKGGGGQRVFHPCLAHRCVSPFVCMSFCQSGVNFLLVVR